MIPGPRTPGEIQAYITTLPASVLACAPPPGFWIMLPPEEFEKERLYRETRRKIDEALCRAYMQVWNPLKLMWEFWPPKAEGNATDAK